MESLREHCPQNPCWKQVSQSLFLSSKERAMWWDLSKWQWKTFLYFNYSMNFIIFIGVQQSSQPKPSVHPSSPNPHPPSQTLSASPPLPPSNMSHLETISLKNFFSIWGETTSAWSSPPPQADYVLFVWQSLGSPSLHHVLWKGSDPALENALGHREKPQHGQEL